LKDAAVNERGPQLRRLPLLVVGRVEDVFSKRLPGGKLRLC